MLAMLVHSDRPSGGSEATGKSHHSARKYTPCIHGRYLKLEAKIESSRLVFQFQSAEIRRFQHRFQRFNLHHPTTSLGELMHSSARSGTFL